MTASLRVEVIPDPSMSAPRPPGLGLELGVMATSHLSTIPTLVGPHLDSRPASSACFSVMRAPRLAFQTDENSMFETAVSTKPASIINHPRTLLGNTCHHRFVVRLPLCHSCYKAFPLFGSICRRSATALVEKPLSSRVCYLELIGFHIHRFLA